ncbi:MAG: methyltransferase domain-containing protein [Acidiferrobacterales bacterium]
MRKISAKRATVQVAKKFVHPSKFLQLLRLARKSKHSPRAIDDPQLRVYSQILAGDFLHLGYFDDPSIAPEALSLHDIEQAQLRYAQLLLEQMSDKDAPVLDVGCGMGGLLSLLLEKGFSPVALTPDRAQALYITKKYPTIPIIEGKFEEMPEERYKTSFGTIITSESFQYLDLNKALSMVDRLLTAGGRWIVSDVFRIRKTAERRSGHMWEDFLEKIQETSCKIIYQQDITENVLPTLGYVDMWGRKAGLPAITFSIEKLQKKHPAIYFLLEELIEDLKLYVTSHLDLISPEIYVREKKYMLLVMEKVSKATPSMQH